MKTRIVALFAIAGLSAAPMLPVSAQQVVELSPARNSQNISADTSITAEFAAENGQTVDPSTVRIVVNGQDVTRQSTITTRFFSYRPAQPFAPGAVQVRVDYRNTRGQARTASWTFNVQAPQPTIQISSVTHNGVGTTPNQGFIFQVTIVGTPNAQATAVLVQDGRTVREISASEVSSGVYVANLTVQRGDRVREGIAIGRLRRQGETIYAAATQPFTLNEPQSPSTGVSPSPSPSPTTPAAQLQPRFTSHDNGDRIDSGSFTLVGQSLPNATVDVTVTSAISVLGVVRLNEETVLDQEVRANNNGEFRITVPAARLPVPGTRYTVRAIAEKDGQRSPETRITLEQE
jgi:hypothetical protein